MKKGGLRLFSEHAENAARTADLDGAAAFREEKNMAGHRLDRTTEDIRREISAILRELKDPRVQGLVSVVRVEVTNDLSYCKVYVSSMEGLEQAKTAAAGLKSAGGFIRRELANRLRLRHVPALLFQATDSIEYSANISRMLGELKGEEDEN